MQEQWLIVFPIALIVHVKKCPWYGGDVACSHLGAVSELDEQYIQEVLGGQE